MKGINFKEPLVNATIERRKTETRRIMMPQPNDCTPDHPQHPMRLVFSEWDKDDKGVHCPTCGNGICIGDGLSVWKPRYNVGEVVYLKEPYRLESRGADVYEVSYLFGGDMKLVHINELMVPTQNIYSILNSQNRSKSGFANKLFMPEWAARYFIRITSVRAERLQEITYEGCIREGIECVPGDTAPDTFALRGWDDGYSFPQDAYAALIDQINGRGTWDSNPFVWAYGYELYEMGKDDGIKA